MSQKTASVATDEAWYRAASYEISIDARPIKESERHEVAVRLGEELRKQRLLSSPHNKVEIDRHELRFTFMIQASAGSPDSAEVRTKIAAAYLAATGRQLNITRHRYDGVDFGGILRHTLNTLGN